MAKPDVTAARLREFLYYDESTGVFTWLVKRNQFSGPGVVAGTLKDKGYIDIAIDRKLYKAHRLAWFYIHGVWPEGQIDHINGIRSDNRITNLRDVNGTTNSQNRRTAAGASWDGRRKSWAAQVHANGKNHLIGRFATREDAYAAYVDAKRRLHPGNTL